MIWILLIIVELLIYFEFLIMLQVFHPYAFARLIKRRLTCYY